MRVGTNAVGCTMGTVQTTSQLATSNNSISPFVMNLAWVQWVCIPKTNSSLKILWSQSLAG
eukprot:8576085-Ditylum_brightwellii.AAC.1